MSSARRDDGFSLVEALVALFVFGLVGVGLLQMQSQSVRTLQRVETRALAAMVAENRLVSLMSARGPVTLGARDGEAELAGRTWRWRESIEATPDPAAVRVTVRVFPDEETLPAATVHAFRVLDGGGA